MSLGYSNSLSKQEFNWNVIFKVRYRKIAETAQFQLSETFEITAPHETKGWADLVWLHFGFSLRPSLVILARRKLDIMKFNRNALKCYKKLIDENNIMIRPIKYEKQTSQNLYKRFTWHNSFSGTLL